ncbi:cation:proton antiporter [Streptomyces sp. URMC 125]|uniref:cation:proton antiporter n=1 Tax=Streptomyces sp. URMC 125 TaxID=3423419 RepID=UPI003F1B73A7
MTTPDVPAVLAAGALSPLGGTDLVVLLLQVGVLLTAAHGLGRLALRVGLPALVGELSAGVLLGPTVLGHAAPAVTGWLFPSDPGQTRLLDAVTQIGLLLLVGVTGAQFDAGFLRRRGATATRVSLAGLLVPLGFGMAAGYLVPGELLAEPDRRHLFAFFLGVALCVTALPVIAKTLAELDLLHRDVGQLVITAAFFDDAVGWLLLAVVSAVAVGGAGGQVAATALYAALFLATALLLRRPLARYATRTRSGERAAGSTLTIAVALVLLYAAGSAAIGMEALFGAFVAGATVLSRVAPSRLAPLRTVVMSFFAPLFLAGIGLHMDLTLLADPTVAATAAGVLAVAVLGKFAGAYLGARASRLGHWEGVALGAGMNARGMIEVVIALAGLRLGVLTTAAFTCIVLVAVVTSVIAPPLLRRSARRIGVGDEERERERRFTGWAHPADGEPLPAPAESRRIAAGSY